MRRRAFIAGLGSAAAWPLVARAQQPAKLPTIGFFGPVKASIDRLQIAIFVERLRELGWIEGRNVAMEYRWAEGRMDRYADIAAELVRQKVDVIVTYSTSTVIALKRATPVIPIVFVSATDPVGNGLVESLPRPGGNATGLSNQSADSVASDWKSCARSFRLCVGWRSCAMLVRPTPYWKWRRFRRRREALVWKSPKWISAAPTISRLPLRQSRAARTRSMSSWTRS